MALSLTNTSINTSGLYGTYSLMSYRSIDRVSMLSNETHIELNAFNDLCFTFKDTTQNHFSNDVLSCTNEYKNACLDLLNTLHSQLHTIRLYPDRVSQIKEMSNLLKVEVETWMLVEVLLRERMSQQKGDADKKVLKSEKELARTFYEDDSVMRQSQLIIDWLEYLSGTSEAFSQHKFSIPSDNHTAWENTLHTLKHTESSSLKNIVTSLDPDAAGRQGRRLLDLDEEDEASLLKYVFHCIRSGQLMQACHACEQMGHSWRAVVLAGWKLQHDDNMRCLGDGGVIKEMEGNQSRLLWKKACQGLMQDEKACHIEKAVLAVLSGNLNCILPLCSTWHDYLWAYFKVFVDQRLELYLKSHCNIFNHFTCDADDDEDTYVGDDGYYGEEDEEDKPNQDKAILSFDSIFEEIETSCNEEVKKQAGFHFNVIQKFLILHDVDELLEHISSWSNMHPQLLRLCTHLLIIFSSHGFSSTEKYEGVLVTWVKYLISHKHVPLVAFYCKLLPDHLQSHYYATLLCNISGTESRKECLQLAEEAGLDVRAITKLVVDMSIRSDEVVIDINSTELTDQVLTEEDMQRISSLEWLLLDGSSGLFTIISANHLLRRFLLSRKIEACKEVVKAVPSSIIEPLLRSNKNITLASEELVDNSVGEFTCTTMFLNSMDTFSEWFELFHHKKPQQASLTSTPSHFAEKVSKEHSMRKWHEEMKRWQEDCNIKAQSALEQLQGVLTFNDGGWMVDLFESDDEDRKRQLDQLRRMYLPSIFHLIIKVLKSSERWKECTCLTDLVASEQYKLYQVFGEEDMERLASKLTLSMVHRIRSEDK